MGMSNVSLYCTNYIILSVRPFSIFFGGGGACGFWVSIFFFKTDTECLDVPLLPFCASSPHTRERVGTPPLTFLNVPET